MKKYLKNITQQLNMLPLGDMPVIKKALAFFITVCLGLVVTAQPNITRVEYYLDHDPGYGLGTALSIVPAKDLSGLSFNINLVPLAQGVHIVGVRSKDANGAWSLDNRWIFLKPYTTGAAAPVPKIKRVEYFIDHDPGYGHATALSIVPNTDLSGLSFNINMTSLTKGVHIVGVRSQDSTGAWSLDNKWIFLKPYTTGAPVPVPKIQRVEYFIDHDPGYGKATALSIVPATNLSGLSFNINMTPLTKGVHIVGVRSQDTTGAWSLDNKWIFLKPYTTGAAPPIPKIQRVEYFVDHDPGYGHATALSIVPATNLSGLSFNINMVPLSQGVHIVGVRSQDTTGAWSLDNEWVFLKPYNGGITTPVPNITQVEYYVDADPGYGHATAVPITPATNLPGLSFSVNISGLAAGSHFIAVRSKDANGAWSLDNKYAITISAHLGSIIETHKMAQDSLTNNLRLQYNPVHQQAVLIYTVTKDDKTAIRVVDNLGRIVLLKETKVFTGVNLITLETARLAQGIYTVQAIGLKETLHVRMVKQ